MIPRRLLQREAFFLAHPEGVGLVVHITAANRPSTSRAEIQRSIQLSYEYYSYCSDDLISKTYCQRPLTTKF